MQKSIDLNCDLGESYGNFKVGQDAQILKYITSCNIACGFHAGDPKTIIQSIKNAKNHQIKIGAHPSYPDLMGFGRRNMDIDPAELSAIIQYQVAALDRLCTIHQTKLHHIKPHGALYNTAFLNKTVAQSILNAIMPWKENVILYAQYGSALSKMALQEGFICWQEGFVDRKYKSNLSLKSRKFDDAVLNNTDEINDQVVDMVLKNKIKIGADEREIHVQTLCIHGDTPNALDIVKNVYSTLRDRNVHIH